MAKSDFSKEFARTFRHSISAIDDFLDYRWRSLERRFGWDGAPHVQPYIGYANDDFAWMHGRVLSNPPKETPSEDDNWWDNLLQMYRRFESDEMPGVEVEIDFAGKQHRVVTDKEGYFHLETANTPDVRGRQPWKLVTIRIVNHHRVSAEESVVISKMLTPPADASFGVISDVDDTVLHTGITSLTAAIRLTFFHNARTRKPLPGVAALYRALQAGREPQTPRQNPLFYISSSPWNLFDLLEDFLDINHLPPGPILLRDLGFDRNKFLKEGHEHKLEKALKVMAAYPVLPFVLFGDSGQEDAQLYAEAARQRPQQVKAIYIRDVDPEQDSKYDSAVRDAFKKAESLGVPMHLISNSLQAAELAIEQGLIAPNALSDIETETHKDFQRPTNPLSAESTEE